MALLGYMTFSETKQQASNIPLSRYHEVDGTTDEIWPACFIGIFMIVQS